MKKIDIRKDISSNAHTLAHNASKALKDFAFEIVPPLARNDVRIERHVERCGLTPFTAAANYRVARSVLSLLDRIDDHPDKASDEDYVTGVLHGATEAAAMLNQTINGQSGNLLAAEVARIYANLAVTAQQALWANKQYGKEDAA